MYEDDTAANQDAKMTCIRKDMQKQNFTSQLHAKTMSKG